MATRALFPLKGALAGLLVGAAGNLAGSWFVSMLLHTTLWHAVDSHGGLVRLLSTAILTCIAGGVIAGAIGADKAR